MDVVGSDLYSIARNVFVRNNNFVTPPKAYIFIDVGWTDILIAAGSFLPRASDAAISIIFIIPRDANLDEMIHI